MTGTCGEVVRSMLRNHCDGTHNNVDYIELFLDFDNAHPTEEEKAVFDVCEAALASCQMILLDVQSYGKGATEEVRIALQNPSLENLQELTSYTVDACVQRIKSYHAMALRIEKLMPDLLWDLCSGPLPPEEQLDNRQALATQLARIVDFVLQFDNAKMCTPALQNDFSYYRRAMKRNEVEPEEIEMANQISLFLANSTPMLNTLARAFTQFVQKDDNLPLANTTDTLATIVSVCRFMINTPDIVQKLPEETRNFCMRVMVGCAILYDHIDDNGIFARESAINVKAVIKAIKEHTEPDQGLILLNGLKFTTRTFFNNTTPKWVKTLLPP